VAMTGWFFATGGVASAATATDDVSSELRELKERVKALEEREKPADVGTEDGHGHRLHPIHSRGEAEISGDLTLVGQGVSSDQLADPATGTTGDAMEGTLSLDLFFEHQVSAQGLVLVQMDVQQGAGLTIVPVFAAPNGNTTGPNNDVESFDSSQIHLDQAYYEHRWLDDRLVIEVGQYDPTMHFDTNTFANTERSQFLANLFVNNPTIEFGGTDNFYGLGAVVMAKPVEWVDLVAGAMEGNGDYLETFTRPWSMVEADFKATWGERRGTYRVYAWQNRSHHTNGGGFNLLAGWQDRKNHGIGVNFDQELTEHVGVWGRYGTQDSRVASFDRSLTAGIQLGGGAFGRPHDALGVGYGLTMIGDEYEAAQAALGSPEFSGNEGYWETYYRYVIDGDAEIRGVSLSPDVQYITNAGGDRSLDPIVVYGLRLQAFF
jgi:carbohydrate-selective porin OprB